MIKLWLSRMGLLCSGEHVEREDAIRLTSCRAPSNDKSGIRSQMAYKRYEFHV